MTDKELVIRLEEDISWLEQGCTTEREICEHIKQAIKTIIQHKKAGDPWHTGTPTEDGIYAVYYWDDRNPSVIPYEALYDGFLSPDGEGNWINIDGEIEFIDDDIARWQKIEPYKEIEK